jgi:hypothetical protein
VSSRPYQKLRDAFVNDKNKFARDEAILLLRAATLQARQLAREAMLKDPDFGPAIEKGLEDARKQEKLDANNLMDILR